MKNVGLSLCGAALLLVVGTSAHALAPFKGAFEEKYVKNGSPALKAAFTELGCNVCHLKGAESKKERNPFGMELAKILGPVKDKIKDDKEGVLKSLDAAFGKVEAMKAPSGKTWAEAIKAGELK